MYNQVIEDQKLASLQSAFSNIKDNLEEEIDNHRESQNFIKLLEDKLGETEAKFIKESNKFKAEKEALENKIKVLEESNIKKMLKHWKQKLKHLMKFLMQSL